MIPVPDQIQRRGWEAAWVLREEYAARMTLEQNVRMEVMICRATHTLGWRDVGDALCSEILMKMRNGKDAKTD